VPAAPDLEQLVRGGVAIVMATRDDRLRPAITRCWGPRLSAGGERLTVCAEAPQDSPTRANLAQDGTPAAITLVLPSTYSSVQVKGVVAQVRPPDDADRRRIAEHAEAFVEDTRTLELPEAVARALQHTEFLTVELQLRERYDQTPGPGAGGAL
jgi:hypothetical protein